MFVGIARAELEGHSPRPGLDQSKCRKRAGGFEQIKHRMSVMLYLTH